MPYHDRKSIRLNSSHGSISYAVFCLKKKKKSLTYSERCLSAAVLARGSEGTITRATAVRLSCDLLSDLAALSPCFAFFFFFNDTATTEIYTLSLHDALPI